MAFITFLNIAILITDISYNYQSDQKQKLDFYQNCKEQNENNLKWNLLIHSQYYKLAYN